jgi:hypothetical protein
MGSTTIVALNGSGSSDPEGQTLTYSWSTTCDGTFNDPSSTTPDLTITSNPPVCPLSCDVTLTVNDEDGLSDTDTTSVTIVDTTHPKLLGVPGNLTVECDSIPDPAAVVATDDCDPSPTLDFSEIRIDGGCSSEYELYRTWTATDSCGNSTSYTQIITVQDTTPPEIQCNAPATITPKEAPISFAATATDNCDGEPLVAITGYNCFFTAPNGKIINKNSSCEVELTGSTINILDSGGVQDNITWTTQATDSCGNVSSEICHVEVVNPKRN